VSLEFLPPATGASFKRGKSKQDYATPKDFREAVIKKFGQPDLDLAANVSNAFANDFYTEEQDSLNQEWAFDMHSEEFKLAWLNPPFGDIAPWAKKCAEESAVDGAGAHILFLVPAAVGSNWVQDYVFPVARVFLLNPRICFDGKNPFPKDCLLCEFGPEVKEGVGCWRWK
jgi:phage N-6-adenine-methyltransferase